MSVWKCPTCKESNAFHIDEESDGLYLKCFRCDYRRRIQIEEEP